VGSLLQDLRYAFRGLVKNPGFTAVALVTLALGIGATTSIYTVVDAVLLRPLPYPDPEQLVRLYVTDAQSGDERDNSSGASFLDWKSQSTSFEALAGFVGKSFNLSEGDHPLRARGTSVTPDFFSVLGIDAALGRTLSPEIDTPEAEPSVVLSDGLWRSQLGGDPSVLGRSLRLNGQQFTVVGVMSPGFAYPAQTQLWTAARYRVPDPPVNLGADPAENRGGQYINVVGRMRVGVSLAGARAEMTAIAERLEREYPGAKAGEGVTLVALQDSMIAEARPLLLVLLGAVGFVLLIACANVANLLLARASQREREIAIRRALGAGRLRIARQLLTESLLLAICGGLAGASLASWGAEWLLALAPDGIPRAAEVSLDLRVLGFTLLVVLGTGILFGLAPVAQLVRRNLQHAMKDGTGGYTVAGGGRRLRGALVAGEVGVSLLLLVGTGLMVRTFLGLTAVDPGFDPEKTLVAHVTLPRAKYAEEAQLRDFQQRVLERLKALPGVESASTVLTLPMHWNIRGTLSFEIDGRPAPDGEAPEAGYQVVSPDYFRTLGVPLRHGRFFTEADNDGAPHVALINDVLAHNLWPNEDPIGQRMSWGNSEDSTVEWVTIVGVVESTHVEGLDVAPRAETYRPYLQDPFPYMTLVLRSAGDAASLSSAVRRAVVEVDPDQPLSGVKTMDQVLVSSLAQRRFNMLLIGAFALVALALAAVGLYGVLSFSVAQRSGEIGIRRALGARPQDVILQVLGEGSCLVMAGLVMGTAGSLALTRLIQGLIHGVSPTDPLSYVLGILLLTTIALSASYVPARRAARVDPAVALRVE
jgi:putative ABC transport system permease protein